jgi:hypothetical protein
MGPCCIRRFEQIRPVVVEQTYVTICCCDGCCGFVHHDHDWIVSKRSCGSGSYSGHSEQMHLHRVVVVEDLRICSYGRIVSTEQNLQRTWV